jgi:hypothetical protein
MMNHDPDDPDMFMGRTYCVGTAVDHWILGKMEKKRGCGN